MQDLPDGYRYTYRNGVFYGLSTSGRSTGPNGHPVEVFYQPACDGNQYIDPSGNGGDRMCRAAFAACPPPKILMWIFQRPAGQPVAPVRTGEHCFGAPRTISLPDAQDAFLRYLREKHLPHPAIATAPPGGGLVNLPQIFATQDSTNVTIDVTEPLPARITAEPHYSWDFGDGAGAGDTPGTPYRPGIYPREHPGYYLEHTYTELARPSITLTVTWRATFTVPGLGRTFPIPDITLTTSRTLTISQARSELLAGG